ncbi:MAG TPA: hypothetical protein VIJ87_09515, partial [Pyrinomonadaceae bacterium]
DHLTLKRVHIIFGLLLFVVFLLTGQYMDKIHNHLRGMADGPRMLYRSRHIYILLSAMLHLGVGSYFSYHPQTARRTMQLIGSLFITIASALFVYAFFYEPNLSGLYTPVSRNGIFLTAIGTLLHLLSGVGMGSEKRL